MPALFLPVPNMPCVLSLSLSLSLFELRETPMQDLRKLPGREEGGDDDPDDDDDDDPDDDRCAVLPILPLPLAGPSCRSPPPRSEMAATEAAPDCTESSHYAQVAAAYETAFFYADPKYQVGRLAREGRTEGERREARAVDGLLFRREPSSRSRPDDSKLQTVNTCPAPPLPFVSRAIYRKLFMSCHVISCHSRDGRAGVCQGARRAPLEQAAWRVSESCRCRWRRRRRRGRGRGV